MDELGRVVQSLDLKMNKDEQRRTKSYQNLSNEYILLNRHPKVTQSHSKIIFKDFHNPKITSKTPQNYQNQKLYKKHYI